jgi:hypothetical protein
MPVLTVPVRHQYSGRLLSKMEGAPEPSWPEAVTGASGPGSPAAHELRSNALPASSNIPSRAIILVTREVRAGGQVCKCPHTAGENHTASQRNTATTARRLTPNLTPHRALTMPLRTLLVTRYALPVTRHRCSGIFRLAAFVAFPPNSKPRTPNSELHSPPPLRVNRPRCASTR